MQVSQALLCCLAYFVCAMIDSFFGWQAMSRPIFLGPIVGLFVGDLKTGAIMGANLEAIYMGVSAIGGVIAANIQVATVVGVGLNVCAGVDYESSVAIATAVGAVLNSLSAVQKAMRAAWHPIMINTLKKGNFKGMVTQMWLQQALIGNGFNIILMFLCLALGANVVQSAIDLLPKFITNGLNAASSMLTVIGLCLTTQCVWMPNAVLYVLLGFVLFQYAGLAILPIAVLGVIIAVLTFNNDLELKNIKESGVAASTEGDDFYG